MFDGKFWACSILVTGTIEFIIGHTLPDNANGLPKDTKFVNSLVSAPCPFLVWSMHFFAQRRPFYPVAFSPCSKPVTDILLYDSYPFCVGRGGSRSPIAGWHISESRRDEWGRVWEVVFPSHGSYIYCLSHKEHEYIWFRGGDINSFHDIQQISRFWGVGLTLWTISNVLHILPVTQGTRI
jgi:hypothetical protein